MELFVLLLHLLNFLSTLFQSSSSPVGDRFGLWVKLFWTLSRFCLLNCLPNMSSTMWLTVVTGILNVLQAIRRRHHRDNWHCLRDKVHYITKIDANKQDEMKKVVEMLCQWRKEAEIEKISSTCREKMQGFMNDCRWNFR